MKDLLAIIGVIVGIVGFFLVWGAAGGLDCGISTIGQAIVKSVIGFIMMGAGAGIVKVTTGGHHG